MSVGHGNANALRGDDRSCRGDDNSALDFTPYAKRLALAFFFFTRDERDHVVNHFGPLGEILPCSGDCLIGSCDDFADTVFEQWSQHRHIALDRAVGLYGDESAARAETAALSLDNGEVRVVDLRDHHGNIARPAVCRIV